MGITGIAPLSQWYYVVFLPYIVVHDQELGIKMVLKYIFQPAQNDTAFECRKENASRDKYAIGFRVEAGNSIAVTCE